jgi:aspartate oxidase
MGSLETRFKIAIFIAAILITAAMVFLVTGGMGWIYQFIASFANGAASPRARITGAVIAGLVLALRMYTRYRAKIARKKK